MKNQPEPWRDRHTPQDTNSRCCWVCGKIGGIGFTAALITAGFRISRDDANKRTEIGYAHAPCIMKAQREANEYLAKQA